MAIDVAPRRRHRAQAQGVGGGAGRHEKHVDFALEDFAQLEFDASSKVICSVWARLPGAARRKGFNYLWRRACDVIARETQSRRPGTV
jgi:hypothetical protein